MITEALLASVTIVLGVIVLAIATGWFNVATADATSDINENILEINTSNMLKIEHLNYTIEEQSVIVRNIAKVPIVITRLELRREAGQLVGSIPSSQFFAKIVTLDKGNTTKLDIPLCTSCDFNEELTLRIWFVASALFDEENPINSADEMKFIETKFLSPVGSIVEKCPLPSSNWILLDVVDPVTFTDTGAILDPPWNVVRIRAPVTNFPSVANLHVTVTGSFSGTGSKSESIPSNTLISISGGFSGITPPMEIVVTSPGYTIIQSKWYLDMLENKIHVSGITLSWTGVDRILTSIAVQLGIAQSGGYVVKVGLYDCEDNLLGEFSKSVSIPPGIDATTTLINLDEGIPLHKVYRIETRLTGG